MCTYTDTMKFWADRKARISALVAAGLSTAEANEQWMQEVGVVPYHSYDGKAKLSTAATGIVHRATVFGYERTSDGRKFISSLYITCGAHRRHQSGGRSTLQLLDPNTPVTCQRCR